MTTYKLAVVCILGFGLAIGSTPEPWAHERLVLDRVLAAAGSPALAGVALEVLERVAMGRNGGIGDELAGQVGIQGSELRRKDFSEPTVRAYALRRIGESGTPDAVEFLAGIQFADVGSVPGQQLWPAAQIALRDARLAQIADPQMQIEFLERILTEPHDAVSNSAVVSWAVDELCNRGAISALPEIRQSIRRRVPGKDGEDEILFCEARVSVFLRNIDRVKALGSVLDVRTGARESRLAMWAIHQLAAMRSAEADRVLSRFAGELEGLQAGSPDDLPLFVFREEIRGILRGRAK